MRHFYIYKNIIHVKELNISTDTTFSCQNSIGNAYTVEVVKQNHTLQKFVVNKILFIFKDINYFINQGHIKLISRQ